MVNPIYPNTHHANGALQHIDFHYSKGSKMSAQLAPQPRVPGASITSVEVEYTSTRWANVPVSQHATLIQAGTQAWHNAQNDAHNLGAQIVRIETHGEEFLTAYDLAQIAGNTVPVTVI